MHVLRWALISPWDIAIASSIPQGQAACLRFPQFFILLAWYFSRDWYTWVCFSHRAASGENGILPDLIRQHFLCTWCMYSPNSLSILLMRSVASSYDPLEVWALSIHSIRQCLITYSTRIHTYSAATCGILVFRRQEVDPTTRCGDWPMISCARKSITKSQWSPMP